MLGSCLGRWGVREGGTQVGLCWPYLDLGGETTKTETVVSQKETQFQLTHPALREKIESPNKAKASVSEV